MLCSSIYCKLSLGCVKKLVPSETGYSCYKEMVNGDRGVVVGGCRVRA